MRGCYLSSAILVVLVALCGSVCGTAAGQSAVTQPATQAAQQPGQTVPSAPVAVEGIDPTGRQQLAARRPRLPGLIPVRPSVAAAELGDWRQPTYTDERLSPSLRRMWVKLTNNGNVVGRVSVYDPQGTMRPAPRVHIQFLQAGRVIAETDTDVKGIFLTTLLPGVYSLVAVGDIGVVATSLTVLPFVAPPRGTAKEESPENTQPPPGVEEQLMLDVAMCPAPLDPVWNLLQKNYSQIQYPVLPEPAPSGQPAPPVEEQMRSFGLAEWIDALSQSEQRPRIEAMADATSIRAHPLVLSEDGRLRGRALRIDPVSGRPVIVRRAEAFLVRDGAVVSRANVGPDGVFDMLHVEPGSYGLTVAGQDGFGAIGVTVVAKNPVLSSTVGDPYFVASNNAQVILPSLIIGLISDPRDLVRVFGDMPPPGGFVPNPPAPGGGGGGGGGGGSDEGGLIGLIGSAITAGALATDRDQGSPVGP